MQSTTRTLLEQAATTASELARQTTDLRKALTTDTDRRIAARHLYAAERHLRDGADELSIAAAAGEPETA